MAVPKNTKSFFIDILLCLFFTFLLHMPRAQATRVQYCDKKGSYAVKVHGVEIFPNPVLSGQPAIFNISASTVATDMNKLIIFRRCRYYIYCGATTGLANRVWDNEGVECSFTYPTPL